MARDERYIKELTGKDLAKRVLRTFIPAGVALLALIVGIYTRSLMILISSALWAHCAYKLFLYGIE